MLFSEKDIVSQGNIISWYLEKSASPAIPNFCAVCMFVCIGIAMYDYIQKLYSCIYVGFICYF